MSEQVIEGTWEEIALQAAKLAGSGQRLKLIIPSEDPAFPTSPENSAALALLEEWLEEEQAVSPEEREEANREWEEFQANLEAYPVSIEVPTVD